MFKHLLAAILAIFFANAANAMHIGDYESLPEAARIAYFKGIYAGMAMGRDNLWEDSDPEPQAVRWCITTPLTSELMRAIAEDFVKRHPSINYLDTGLRRGLQQLFRCK